MDEAVARVDDDSEVAHRLGHRQRLACAAAAGQAWGREAGGERCVSRWKGSEREAVRGGRRWGGRTGDQKVVARARAERQRRRAAREPARALAGVGSLALGRSRRGLCRSLAANKAAELMRRCLRKRRGP